MQDFGTKADDTAGPSGQLSAAEFNNIASENENSVLRSGQALNGSSETQLAQSLFIHSVKAGGFQDSGAANAYVATPISGSGGVLLPSSYAALNGSTITFSASATNSGASTLNIGQTTGTLLGAKALRTQADTALVANTIVAGQHIQVKYNAAFDGGSGAWVLLPWAVAENAAHGLAVFVSSGSWTVPAGVTQAFVEVYGGGGGGARLTTGTGPSGGGGGGITKELVNLIGVTSVTITVGAGGAGGINDGDVGLPGGTSSFGAFCSATGGSGGTINGNAAATGTGSGGDINWSIGQGSVAVRNAQDTGFNGGAGGGGESIAAATGTTVPTMFGQGGGGRLSNAGVTGASGAVIIRW